MKKVAFWTTLSDGGGSEFVWQELAEMLGSQDHRIFVSLFDYPANAKFLERSKTWRDGLQLRRPRKSLAMSVAGRFGISLENSSRPLIEAKPDALVINSDTTGWIADSGLAAAIHALDVPYVVIVHGSGGFFEDPVRENAQKLYADAKAIFFVSDYTRKMTERHLAMTLPNARLFRNPVNGSIDKSNPPPYPSMPNGPVFATVSRLNCYTKGHDYLFEALSDPVFQARDFSVKIYGDGQHARYLHELIGHFGLANRVQMMGFASDINEVWSTAHVHLLPSITEGAPLALVEAMLCGRPSVATRVSGVPEWIDDGVEGYLSENANVWNLIPALEKALSTASQLEEMGQRARLKAMSLIGDPVSDLRDSMLSLDGFL